MTAMEQRMLAGGSWTPDETPDGTPECLSGAGPGLPLQMHAFVPGGLHDHPPSTSSVMVVMQSLGVAEHQQGQPGAGSWPRGHPRADEIVVGSGGSPADAVFAWCREPGISLAWEPPRHPGLCREHAHQTRWFSGGFPGDHGVRSAGGAVVQKVFDQLHERVAGLDVHKAQVTAAVRVPDSEGGRLQDVAEFSTTVRGLLGLCDWLEAAQDHASGDGSDRCVLAAAVWAIVEDRFDCILVNARDVKRPRAARPISATRHGSRSCWRRACCARASCRQADPHAQEPHPVSQDTDRGASA